MSKFKRQPKVVIIGSGMTGILLHIKLKEAGIDDITIFEKKSKVGGTWRENTYPGLTCDIPAVYYAYSWLPSLNWSQTYATGAELQDYFQSVSDRHGVTDNVHFDEAVVDAQFDGKQWQVKTSKGTEMSCDFVFSATGNLHIPAKPQIEGLKDFQGACFHTAEWDHSVDLADKRVGIIGTGSTSLQVCSELLSRGVDMHIFQRTPQWVVPITNFKSNALTKAFFKYFPFANKIARRLYKFLFVDVLTKSLVKQGNRHKLLRWACIKHVEKVKDPVLRKKLTPDYEVGCKRIIASDRYYDQIQKPNAHLITDGIEKIEANGIRTRDGKLHELDVLVLATGFDAHAFMRPMALRGENGQSINDVWAKKFSSYRSLFVPGFPNFFLMLGPNSPVGNLPLTYISELQAKYAIKLINLWREEKMNSVDAKSEAAQEFIEFIKRGLPGTVWTTGCDSWYLDEDGDPVLWPYGVDIWEKQMVEPNLDDFNFA